MSKRLVICCDGTWNVPDQRDPTNVVRMARAVLPTHADGTPQVVFYDQGVGTGNLLDSITGGAFGNGLVKNVLDAYRFLIHNFEDGDQLFIFGFSRGAYTARSLVGLLRNCGLLQKHHADKADEAVALYRRPDEGPDSRDAQEFRTAHSRPVEVHFLGVWDTVGALGIPLRWFHRLTRAKHQFHDVKLSKIVHNAYHALAIDERRFAFRPSIWTGEPKAGQTVEQRWFTGVHSDIGGGYGLPDTGDGDSADPVSRARMEERGLSGVTFTWMKGKAEACGLGFDEGYIQRTIVADPLGPKHESRVSYYRLSPPHVRTIGTPGATHEGIHESVEQRMELTSFDEDAAGYAPVNVTAYKRMLGSKDEDA